jgi:hypothetical protein
LSLSFPQELVSGDSVADPDSGMLPESSFGGEAIEREPTTSRPPHDS